MAEPSQLLAARKHLARAEANFRSGDGLFHLEAGLALLDEVIASDASEHQTIARNLACTYSAKIYGCVQELIEADRGLPEPALEHLFKVVLAFDQGNFTLPQDARSLKISVVRRLVDLYYEGHSAEEKRKVLQQLAEVSRTRDG